MKIKKNRFSIRPAAAALIGLLAMASCGHDDRLASESAGAPAPGELVPLGITTSLDAELTPNAQATTKAAVTSGSMGVYMYPNAVYNREYSYTAGAWTATSPILLGGENASVLAVYPRTTPSSTNGDKIMFPVFQAYSAANDIRYASSGTPASVSNVSPDVSLTLKHLYSRIKMKVDLSSGDTGSGTLNSITLEFYNKPSVGTDAANAKLSYAGVQISDGSLFAATSSTTTSYSQTIGKTLTGGTPNEDFDMLCSSFTGWLLGGGAATTTAITAVVITVKFDNVNYRTSILASTFLAGGLQAGKQYTVTLKLQRGVTVTAQSVTVEDWGTTSDAGSEDIYAEESDYYVVTGGTDPVTIGGIKWARSNLVQTGSGVTAPVSLAGAPLGAGSHWNWGMRDATRCTEFDMQYGADPWDSPTPGDDNQDPCRSLGTGWRLPTQTELGKLVDKAAPSGTKVKIGNTTGTIGTKGWCPELKCAVCMDNGQLLALPITGYRGNDSFVVIDDGGYYWSSTPVGTDRAGLLTLYEGALYATGSEERNYAGLSVRCVKDN